MGEKRTALEACEVRDGFDIAQESGLMQTDRALHIRASLNWFLYPDRLVGRLVAPGTRTHLRTPT